MLKRIDHPNIIKFYEVSPKTFGVDAPVVLTVVLNIQAFEDQKNLYIVTELCSGGELFDRITARGHYTEKDAAKVLRQVFEGVHYLHTHKVTACL